MKKHTDMNNVKKADISEPFAINRIPSEAARLSTGNNAIVALLSMPFSELIKGGRSGAKKREERAQYPGLEALIQQHIPDLPNDFADRLNLPVWYYLQKHMIKRTVDPTNGTDVLFVILKREKDKSTKTEVYTILNLTKRVVERIGSNNPLFARAQEIHITEQTAKLAEINDLAAKHDEFMRRLRDRNNPGSITAWCPMVGKAIRLAQERKDQLSIQRHAMDSRPDSAKLQDRLDAESRFRGGEDEEFRSALSNQGFFRGVEDVIVHIMSKYPINQIGRLRDDIRNGSINLQYMVANLSQQVGQERAQAIVTGIKNFIQDIAGRMQEYYDNNLDAKKVRQDKVSKPKAGDGEPPNIPNEIGQFDISDMPDWVHGRLQGYTNSMQNYKSQGFAMSDALDSEMAALKSLIDHMQIVFEIICKDSSFPKNRAALINNPEDAQTVSAAKQVMIDYFQKYSSDFFVEDESTGDLRIDKRKIGSGEAGKSMANLILATYLHHIWATMNKMGY